MFRATAYDTTACQGHVIEPLKQAVLNAIIQGNLQPHPNNPDVVLVQGGAFVNETIKSFAHPLAVGHGEHTKIAVDMRTTGKFDPLQESFVIRDKEAYQGLLLRGHLTDLWVNHSPDPLRNFSNLPMQLYASWLAERIAKRLGLEVKAQTQVHILAALFYLNNFWKDETPPKEMIVHLIQRSTRLPEQMILDVLNQVTVILDLEAFCTACYEVTQSTRFKTFNAGLVIAIVISDWYGPNAREVVAVALEHPPTWLSLIWEGFNNRGMHNSGLSQILERTTYRNQKDLFTNALVNLARV